jgi:hypothetical protein
MTWDPGTQARANPLVTLPLDRKLCGEHASNLIVAINIKITSKTSPELSSRADYEGSLTPRPQKPKSEARGEKGLSPLGSTSDAQRPSRFRLSWSLPL